jgi:hypothetical protein
MQTAGCKKHEYVGKILVIRWIQRRCGDWHWADHAGLPRGVGADHPWGMGVKWAVALGS